MIGYIGLLVFTAGSMVLTDLLGTALVSAIAKGRGRIAGLCDAAGDLASLGAKGIPAVAIATHGLTLYSLGVIATMACSSYFTTRNATAWTSKHLTSKGT